MDRRITDKRAANMKSSIILAAGLGKRVREYSLIYQPLMSKRKTLYRIFNKYYGGVRL